MSVFRSFGVIAIALGLVLSIGLSFAQEDVKPTLKSDPVTESEQERTAPAGQNSSGEKKPERVDFVTAIKGVERAIRDLIAEEDKIERKRKHDQEIRDLSAQEDMAFWAKLMFWASAVTVALTFAALFTIVRTLQYTKHAATSAKEAVAVTRDIGEAQVRAYLHCKVGKFHLKKDSIEAILIIENKGQSPANNVSITGELNLLSISGVPSMPRCIASKCSLIISSDVEPVTSGGLVEGSIFFTDFDFEGGDSWGDDEVDGSNPFEFANEIFLALVVEWTDVFAGTHEFALEMDAAIDAGPNALGINRRRTGKLHVRIDDRRLRFSEELHGKGHPIKEDGI